MLLTNNKKYKREESTGGQAGLGSKHSSWLLSWHSEEESDDEAKALWSKLGDICVMTLLRIADFCNQALF